MLPTLVQREPELGNMLQKMAPQEQLEFFNSIVFLFFGNCSHESTITTGNIKAKTLITFEMLF